MSAFLSLSDLKSAAEFFPAGKIIPRRILKVPRRYSSHMTFGSNTWVLNTTNGYLCAVDFGVGELCAIRIKSMKNANLRGSPYHQGGHTLFVGNEGKTDAQWLADLNKCLTLPLLKKQW